MQVLNKRRFNTRLIPSSVIVLLVVIGVVTALEVTNTTYFFHKRPVETTASSTTKGEPVSTDSQASPAASSSTATKPSTTPTTSSGASTNEGGPTPSQKDTSTSTTLAIQISDFVSAHHVQLNSSLVSVCNATSGASCVIAFTKDGVSKSLAPEITDKGGSAYWNSWTPKSVGLTVGSWQIQAVATMGSQTKSANDAMSLEVSQ